MPDLMNHPNVVDIDLFATQKKKFRFNNDDSRIVELNTSDMNFVTRASEVYPRLKALQDKAMKMSDGVAPKDDATEEETMSQVNVMAERLKQVDTEMRECIDFLFDAPVSAAAAPDGSMYDPFNGMFRYEYIINALVTQYENNLSKEFKAMEAKFKAHTNKYTKP